MLLTIHFVKYLTICYIDTVKYENIQNCISEATKHTINQKITSSSSDKLEPIILPSRLCYNPEIPKM